MMMMTTTTLSPIVGKIKGSSSRVRVRDSNSKSEPIESKHQGCFSQSYITDREYCENPTPDNKQGRCGNKSPINMVAGKMRWLPAKRFDHNNWISIKSHSGSN
jgi:hypothetical protein